MHYSKHIVEEINHVISQINEDDIERVSKHLLTNKRIFVTGEGRSGLMGKSFAMRLMHLGLTVFVIGETITPALQANDILIAVSGSGTTKSVIDKVEIAQRLNCQIISFTTNNQSQLAEKSVESIIIPAATKYRRSDEFQTIQPLGSLFDQSLHVVLDTVCLYVAKGVKADHDDAFKRHSNVE